MKVRRILCNAKIKNTQTSNALKIEVTLGGAFTQFIPAGNHGNRFVFDSDESTSPNATTGTSESMFAESVKNTPMNLAQLLDCLGIDLNQPLMTILNGSVIQIDTYATTQLADNDKLALMPPITAG